MAQDSADVWTNPEQFKLDKNGKPIVVAGVPPDYFSTTGQLWGNPLYNWERMQADGFKWWIERVRATLTVVDIVRVDHFRGFAACWEIPGGDKTAERGQWVEAPGRELFTAIRKTLGELPIIAEDLGVITPDVVALREEFGFPGMRILQFGFGSDSKNIDLPHNYVPNVVAYTGTHDNDTTVGWFQSVAGEGSTRTAKQIERERKFCLELSEHEGRRDSLGLHSRVSGLSCEHSDRSIAGSAWLGNRSAHESSQQHRGKLGVAIRVGSTDRRDRRHGSNN